MNGIGFLNRFRNPAVLFKSMIVLRQLYPDFTFYYARSNEVAEQYKDVISKHSNLNFIECDITTTRNVAQAKNILLRNAHADRLAMFCIIEDDIEILHDNVIQEYFDLLEEYKLGLIFFGYGGELNYVFGKPNPRLILNRKTGKPIIGNAMPCGSLMCFNTQINQELFDESLHFLELKEYIFRMRQKNLLPFTGIYFDIDKSYDRISSVKLEPSRKKDFYLLMLEGQLLKSKKIILEVCNNLDTIFSFVNHETK